MCAFRCILVIDIQIEACDKYTQITSNKTPPTAPQAINFMKRKRLLANAALRTHDEWLMIVFHCAQHHFARKTCPIESQEWGSLSFHLSCIVNPSPLWRLPDSEAGQSMYLRSRYNSCRLEFGVVSTWQSKKTSTWSASWSVATSSLHNPSASSAKTFAKSSFWSLRV